MFWASPLPWMSFEWWRRDPDRDQSSRLRCHRRDSSAGLGRVVENATNEKGERLIWLDRDVVARLRAMRGRARVGAT